MNNTTTTENLQETSQDGDISTIVYITISSVISIMILIVNGIVLLVVYKRRSLLKGLSNKIVLSLVLSDLLTGVSMLLHIISSIHPDLALPRQPFAFCYRVFVDIITLWLQLVTMGTLFLIITERYISLRYPFRMDRYINRKSVVIAITVIWIISFAYSSIQLSWLHVVLDGEWTMEEDNYIGTADSIFSCVSILTFVLLPIVILFIMFLCMFQEIRKFPSINETVSRREEKRIIISFAIMYITFVLLTLPYFVMRLMMDLSVIKLVIRVPIALKKTSYFLKCLPGVTNTYIYVLKKPDFKREFTRNKTLLNNYITSRTPSFLPRMSSPASKLDMCGEPNNRNNIMLEHLLIAKM